MSPAEAITAATINGAYALGCGDRCGSLQPGKRADLLMLNVEDYREIAHQFGVNHVHMVVKNGATFTRRARLRVGPASSRVRAEFFGRPRYGGGGAHRGGYCASARRGRAGPDFGLRSQSLGHHVRRCARGRWRKRRSAVSSRGAHRYEPPHGCSSARRRRRRGATRSRCGRDPGGSACAWPSSWVSACGANCTFRSTCMKPPRDAPDRVNLANIRRGRCEKLREEIRSFPRGCPISAKPRSIPRQALASSGRANF